MNDNRWLLLWSVLLISGRNLCRLYLCLLTLQGRRRKENIFLSDRLWNLLPGRLQQGCCSVVVGGGAFKCFIYFGGCGDSHSLLFSDPPSHVIDLAISLGASCRGWPHLAAIDASLLDKRQLTSLCRHGSSSLTSWWNDLHHIMADVLVYFLHFVPL